MRRFLCAAIVSAACTYASIGGARSPGDGDDFSSGSDDNSSSGGGGGDWGGGGDDSSSSSGDWGSGGGSDGGGGGGGSTRLSPAVSIMIFVVAAIGLTVVVLSDRKKKQAWTTEVTRTPSKGRRALDPIKERDPEFSTVVFEDFVHGLFAEAQRARGEQRLLSLSQFVDSTARGSLQEGSAGLRGVDTVVVGAMQYREVVQRAQYDDISIGFIANYTEVDERGGRHGFVVKETWTFTRRRDAQSPPVTELAVRIHRCPSCGSPAERVDAGTCAHCGKVVDRGDFDWVVTSVEQQSKKPRTAQLGVGGKPRGQSKPSVLEWSARADLARVEQRDPTFSEERFGARLDHVFAELQKGWSERDWERVRPFLSDALFSMWNQQMSVYRELGLINVLDGARITKLELAKVETDKHYDAITVRIFVTGRDYRIREKTREVVSGDPERDSPYTEYWTLIRSTSATGAPRTEITCPACGAPSKINMAGVCAHCSAKITSGRFDWVLSRIEQDSAYSG